MNSPPPQAREGAAAAARPRLPSAPDAGTMPGRADVRYAFSGRADGTLSGTVGDGDAVANGSSLLRRHALPEPLRLMRQVHGRTVAVVGAEVPSDPGALQADVPEADAIVTAAPSTTLGVLVADCVGLVLAVGDAVAAVHAGREGVAAGVVGAAVRRAVEVGGATAPDAVAVIGPAIGPCCYEVPGDMADAVDRVVPGSRATTSWGTPSLDLPGAVARQLRDAGVGDVHRAGGCTRCDPDRWFSHRASTGGHHAPGRQVGLVARVAR